MGIITYREKELKRKWFGRIKPTDFSVVPVKRLPFDNIEIRLCSKSPYLALVKDTTASEGYVMDTNSIKRKDLPPVFELPDGTTITRNGWFDADMSTRIAVLHYWLKSNGAILT